MADLLGFAHAVEGDDRAVIRSSEPGATNHALRTHRSRMDFHQIGAMARLDQSTDQPGGRGRTSHQDETGKRHSASARISTAPATWSDASSTKSSSAAASQRATTSSRRTTSPSFSLRRYAYGCALMSPRPSVADLNSLPFLPQARKGTSNPKPH